jgi:hypothetical protein
MSEIDLDDEWMQVYNTPSPYNKDLYCNSINLKDGIYYHCWGGGPSGGFIALNNNVYEVNQDYNIPLHAILLNNMNLQIFVSSDEIIYCKIIESK